MIDERRYEVIVSPAAEADLDAIADYLIEQGAAAAATRLLTVMLDRIATLDHMPMRGAVPKELEGASWRRFRQCNSGPYRIIYHVGDARVTVVLVVDGRRDMIDILHERIVSSPAPDA